MLPLSLHIPFIIGVILLMVIVLLLDRFKASSVFLVAIALILLAGVLPIKDFVAGFSNTSILTIFLLIIITAAINDHFVLARVFDKAFGSSQSTSSFILRMGGAVASVSAFMNNTPVVAMMMPYVYKWSKKNNVNPSKLLIPLSYAAIVGGVITLIGTSTNLVLNGLLQSNGVELLAFSDFLVPGLLVAVSCLMCIYFMAPGILPDAVDVLRSFKDNTREYLVETLVAPNAAIAGKTIEEAGLRSLKGVFLTEIVRSNNRITPVKPNQVIQRGDVLLFAGETETIIDLFNNGKGLEPSKKTKFEIPDNAEVIEAIVSQNSSLDRKTVKQAGFREKYDAAIVGIHRRGEKISGKIGSIALHSGDLLLLTAGPDFRVRNNQTEDFIVLNSFRSGKDLPQRKKTAFLIGFILSIGLAAAGVINLFESLSAIVLIQLLLGMIDLEKVKQNISFDLLIILITALALGKALINTGAAAELMDLFFTHVEKWNPFWVLSGIFLITFILTSLITNIAAISIVFPVVFSLASSSAIPDKALYLTAAYAASCCFLTPIAYQTNLMVMEAGNYKFKDFIKLGLPVSAVYALVYLIYAAFKFDIW